MRDGTHRSVRHESLPQARYGRGTVYVKERTLRGVHLGEALFMGRLGNKVVQATIWDSMLLLARNKMPHPLVKKWRGWYIVGGRFWKPVPHAFVKNPLNLICYEDTFMSILTWPIRPLLRWRYGR